MNIKLVETPCFEDFKTFTAMFLIIIVFYNINDNGLGKVKIDKKLKTVGSINPITRGGGHKVPGLGLRLALTPLGSKLRAHTS